MELISKISNNPTPFILVNGASGDRITVKSLLEMLRDALGVDIEIKFNGTVRPGDPSYYHADISKLREMGMQPKVMLNEGIVSYVDWIKTCLK